ncbi:MAG: hypothetical protein ACLRXQ_04460 [Phascolarctobacterium faecium]
MFIDRARIYVEAGAGSDGRSNFRREKFVEKAVERWEWRSRRRRDFKLIKISIL